MLPLIRPVFVTQNVLKKSRVEVYKPKLDFRI